jgi:hypothetical protein
LHESLANLEKATRLIAHDFAGPHCVEAAALTVEVGTLLGFDLHARPVSMFAAATNGQSVATGVQGRAFGEQFLRSRGSGVEIGGAFEGGTPFQGQAGHMIVVSQESRLLLDPTFAQFKDLGDSAVALFASEVDSRANGRYWELQDENFLVRYFAADDFMDDRFDAVRAVSLARANQIIDYIRN